MEDAKILELLRRAQGDSEWVSNNYEELRQKHENKVFAVKDGRVVEEASKVEDLLRKLEERGQNPAFLLIESIPPKDASFIL